jgi:GAF domain-containing protein
LVDRGILLQDIHVSGGHPDSAAQFARAARELAEVKGVLPTLQAVVDHAVILLPARWAAVATMDEVADRPPRLTANNDDGLAGIIAAIAGEVGSSPGICAYRTGRPVLSADLTDEGRFPGYAATMVQRTPVRSVLSVPLLMHGSSVGVLSCYADHPYAFRPQSVTDAEVLAIHAVVAVRAAEGAGRAEHLEAALHNSRTIGAAVGILIERFRLTPDSAWARLRKWSQDLNRPVATLAAELVETGTVDGVETL